MTMDTRINVACWISAALSFIVAVAGSLYLLPDNQDKALLSMELGVVAFWAWLVGIAVAAWYFKLTEFKLLRWYVRLLRAWDAI